MSKIDDLKELMSLLKDDEQSIGSVNPYVKNEGLCDQIGEYVIIRTYSAGVWFGKLEKKADDEVYLTEARRMYQWWCAKSISLSGVAKYGIIEEKSKICPALERVWLKAIEILTLSDVAIKSLKEAKDVVAE